MYPTVNNSKDSHMEEWIQYLKGGGSGRVGGGGEWGDDRG